MVKILKYVGVICLMLIIVSLGFKYFDKTNKLDDLNNKITNIQKVFENPKFIVYEVNNKEKFKLTKDNQEYNEILDILNSSLIEGYTSKEVAFKEMGYGVPLEIVDIRKEIYLKNSVLRLLYSDTYEIDIIFEEDSVLDIIYIENGKTDCFYGFENNIQEEIKNFIDNI